MFPSITSLVFFASPAFPNMQHTFVEFCLYMEEDTAYSVFFLIVPFKFFKIVEQKFDNNSFINEPPRPEVANKFAAGYLVSVASFTRASSVRQAALRLAADW
ncbi:MAG: hypothetical protein LBD86_04060, partial [Spirochaetaceae bacterium]|nr:hypothetical protein [Spirochaetaceae bacterium]